MLTSNNRLKLVASIFVVIGASGCANDGVQPPPPDHTSRLEITSRERRGTMVSPERDNRWRHMSDTALESEVVRAGGRVAIGFKEASEAEGVDGRGRVLVSAATARLAKSFTRVVGAYIRFEFDDMPSVIATIDPKMIHALRSNPIIEYVEPILPGTWSSQDTTWNVSKVSAPTAWASSNGTGKKLLILDSGIEQNSADLSAPVVGVCDNSNQTWDLLGHGTNVAGVAAALDNSLGVVGVAHGATLWVGKIGTYFPDPAATACGVQFGRTNGVSVINISASFVSPLTALTDQINAAYYTDDILVVVAAGNNSGPVEYPASLGASVAVSGTTSLDGFASFSSYGSKIEISAPAVNVVTTCLGNTVCAVNGTSFAAPAVAGAVALLRSYNSSWNAAEIRRRLAVGATDLGTPGRDNYFGYGRLNVAAALSALAPSPPTVTIDGPTSVVPFSQCVWSADVSGGVSPLTYRWENGGTLLATSPSFTFTNGSNHGESFQLKLTVTGADLSEVVVTRTVAASNSAQACPS